MSESDLEASLCGDFEYIIYLCDDMIFTIDFFLALN